MKALLCLIVGLTLPVMAADTDKLKAYPAPEDGMSRHVIDLPARENEDDAKVQIIVGKTVETDGVNRNFFGGALEQRTIKGWGYNYHILPVLGPMASTRMAAPPGAPKVEKFVPVGGEPYLIRYNSKLPVVVYVPDGCEVRYRIWSAPADAEPVPEG
ncbi:ecotin [Haloferula helveola]|uniref:Ecotin n=1 Tax=Haloferula helveola TaxID=490095 RepID=A0ABM7RB38_9BACT|nr:ecotin [Haloferula helveola]